MAFLTGINEFSIFPNLLQKRPSYSQCLSSMPRAARKATDLGCSVFTLARAHRRPWNQASRPLRQLALRRFGFLKTDRAVCRPNKLRCFFKQNDLSKRPCSTEDLFSFLSNSNPSESTVYFRRAFEAWGISWLWARLFCCLLPGPSL